MYAFPGDRSIASLWRAFFFGKLAISPPPKGHRIGMTR
jgi:hypothetical protein